MPRKTVKERMKEERNWLIAFRNRMSIEYNIPLDILAGYAAHTITTLKQIEEANADGLEGLVKELIATHITVWSNVFQHLGFPKETLMRVNKAAMPQLQEFIYRYHTQMQVHAVHVTKKGVQFLNVSKEEKENMLKSLERDFPGIQRENITISGKKYARKR